MSGALSIIELFWLRNLPKEMFLKKVLLSHERWRSITEFVPLSWVEMRLEVAFAGVFGRGFF